MQIIILIIIDGPLISQIFLWLLLCWQGCWFQPWHHKMKTRFQLLRLRTQFRSFMTQTRSGPDLARAMLKHPKGRLLLSRLFLQQSLGWAVADRLDAWWLVFRRKPFSFYMINAPHKHTKAEAFFMLFMKSSFKTKRLKQGRESEGKSSEKIQAIPPLSFLHGGLLKERTSLFPHRVERYFLWALYKNVGTHFS